ncbi:hypothetical protein [Paenibacillus sp. AR247]|uniref:hypothetical protein n=1 Tax=Paenibacillus sp. AR247 TaxID=1631599 RepID=UPI0015E3A5B5|nr:hypothetical protein [Paenibacillus sp. AR247]
MHRESGRSAAAGQGIRPLSGCWYYNEASKRTLESAGMVTRTRLLRMKVVGQEG